MPITVRYFAAAAAVFSLPCAAQTPLVPRRLPAPPMTATPRKIADVKPARTRLVLVSKTANEITDDAAWFAKNNLVLPDYRLDGTDSMASGSPISADAQASLDGFAVQRALPTESGKRVLFLYGNDYGDVTRLLCADRLTRKPVYALDFANYRSPPSGKIAGTAQPLVFAAEDAAGSVLYVAHAINGYAKDVRGQTGYVTAIEPKTGKILWRSAPLSHNAGTFALVGDVLVCGYGFTAEPDYLRLLDRRTGRVVQTIPLKSGPSVIVHRGNRIYVRCYDTDYVFAVKP